MLRRFDAPNYNIDLDGEVVILSVFRRPDLSAAAGARLGEEAAARVIGLLSSGPVTALVIDNSAAPSVFGPRTEAALMEMLQVCKYHRRRCAIVTGPGVSWLQVERLLGRAAYPGATVVATLDDARRWLRGAP